MRRAESRKFSPTPTRSAGMPSSSGADHARRIYTAVCCLTNPAISWEKNPIVTPGQPPQSANFPAIWPLQSVHMPAALTLLKCKWAVSPSAGKIHKHPGAADDRRGNVIPRVRDHFAPCRTGLHERAPTISSAGQQSASITAKYQDRTCPRANSRTRARRATSSMTEGSL